VARCGAAMSYKLLHFARGAGRHPAIFAALAGLLVLMSFLRGDSHTDAPVPTGRSTSKNNLATVQRPLPRVEPLELKPISREAAIAINGSAPLGEAGPAAEPMVVPGSNPRYSNALDCLTAAIYYEAASEPVDGQRAVAQVVLNRVRHPAFPASVCSVVFQGAERVSGCQFTFTCDGALRRAPQPRLWADARSVAKAALSGSVFAEVGYATHYHADYVVPYWASSLVKSAVLGRHIFYRWSGWWGRPSAFRQSHRLSELSFLRLVDASRERNLETPTENTRQIPANGLTLGSRLRADDLAMRARSSSLRLAADEMASGRIQADVLAGELIGSKRRVQKPASELPKSGRDPGSACPTKQNTSGAAQTSVAVLPTLPNPSSSSGRC
jgi:hypothetical protein